MWVHNLDPVLFAVFGLEVRYYGLAYILGFLISVWWMKYLVGKKKIDWSMDEIWDLMFWLMVGVLVGSRLFEIFWEPSIYLNRPWELLFIWKGGMSFHGGLVGIVIAGVWWCRRKGKDFWRVADALSVPTMLALALGRVANFINGELVGWVWDGSWCVNFRQTGGGDVCRHPSTLYAAGKRFVVFGWLVLLSWRESFKPGFIFWNFVLFEGAGRFFVDFYREDVLYWGLSLGQWFSVVMVIVSLAVFWKGYRSEWKSLLKGKK